MSSTISVSVDTGDYSALTGASKMLHDLAAGLSESKPPYTGKEVEHPVTKAGVDIYADELTEAQPFADEAVGSTPYTKARAEDVDAGIAERLEQNGPQFLFSLDGLDVWTDTEITLAQHGQLPAEVQALHTGRVTGNPVTPSTDTSTANVFAENPVDPKLVTPAPSATETGTPLPGTPLPSATTQTETDTPASPATAPARQAYPSTPATAALTPAPSAAAAPSSVKLADGIPWDHRIHGSGKTVLAKAPNGWKLKRKPKEMDAMDWDALVQEVEAELRAAMAVPGPATVPNAAGAAIAPSTSTLPAAAPATVSSAAPAAASLTSGTITTMAELMPAVTAASITPAALLAAVQKTGIQSIPLLGTRTDLIPQVAIELGLGG